jgi:hypothetical protein
MAFLPHSLREIVVPTHALYIVYSSHESTKHAARKEFGRGA